MRTALPQAGSMNMNSRKTAHIMILDAWWVMTYQGHMCQIKNTDNYLDDHHRYRRNGWTSETTARTQAAKLNELFQTQDFAVRRIPGAEDGSS